VCVVGGGQGGSIEASAASSGSMGVDVAVSSGSMGVDVAVAERGRGMPRGFFGLRYLLGTLAPQPDPPKQREVRAGAGARASRCAVRSQHQHTSNNTQQHAVQHLTPGNEPT
jgi:hypothetical protein